MGRPTEDGESPVCEKRFELVSIQSTAGHVKPGGKTGGPPTKPKCNLMTDRGAVPGGKGEEDPEGGAKEEQRARG